MSQELDITGQITALAGTIKSQKFDEPTRLQALNAARNLLETLESPVERIIQDVVMVSLDSNLVCCNMPIVGIHVAMPGRCILDHEHEF